MSTKKYIPIFYKRCENFKTLRISFFSTRIVITRIEKSITEIVATKTSKF